MATSHKLRRERLFEKLPADINTVFLSPGQTMRYFTGLKMHKSERPMLFGVYRDRNPVAILPALEEQRVREVVGDDVSYFLYKDAADPVGAAQEAFREYTDEIGPTGQVAVDFRSTRLVESRVLSNIIEPDELTDASGAVAQLREKKDSEEVNRLRRAAEIIDDVLSKVVTRIQTGMTEKEVGNLLHKQVLDTDADSLGSLIVASGPNSAKPHTSISSREIQQGDPLIIDAGVIYEGYYSDITRTFLVGEDSQQFREIHNVVRKAAREAREAVRPGQPLQEIDRVARQVITDAGYGEMFPHRLGHGLGLEVHEPPYLVEGNEAQMLSGHAVTIEPGIYKEGAGGARVEDDVVVTESGKEVLTSSPRELRVI